MAAACDAWVRAANRERRGVAPRLPELPREVLLASRVSLDGLRPWEYWAMGFWEYERVAHAQECLRRARELYPPGWDARGGPSGPDRG